jgi:acyl carrier protein
MPFYSTIRNFVVENFLFGDDSQLDDDASFLEAGVIDSTGILELISFIEETYNIHVGDEELVPENLDSLNNVVQYLQQKLNLRSGVAP